MLGKLIERVVFVKETKNHEGEKPTDPHAERCGQG
jgi:hypothetical protein